MNPTLRHLIESAPTLGVRPTPLHRFAALSEKLGVEVDLKRDDLIGDLVTGTKVRALSFILDQARRDGVTDLISLGEPTSNQCRSVAVLGARHGMSTHLLLRGTAEDADLAEENMATLEVFGAQCHYLSEEEWRLHGMAAKRLMSRIRKAGGKALFIPFGCGGWPGALGIFDLFHEILAAHDGVWPYSHMVVPTGSGAALSGLDMAAQIFQTRVRDSAIRPKFWGVSVSQDAESLLAGIDRNYASVGRGLGKAGLADLEFEGGADVRVEEGWRNMTSAMLLEQMQRVAEDYGVLPDPYYVLRSYLALERWVADGEIDSSAKILVLVSGACRTLSAIRRRAFISS